MRELTYAAAISEAMKEEMIRDEHVFTFGVQVGLMGGLSKAYDGLLEEFGEGRVIDSPISEQSFTGMAVGAAIAGMRPVVELMYIDIAALAMHGIVNDAAKASYRTDGQFSVPVVIRTQGGAGIGRGMIHSQSLESWFTHVPGLKVVMPATPYDVKGLLKASIRDNNPVMFIENKEIYKNKAHVPDEDYTIPLGKGEIKREGKDVTVIAYSSMLYVALEAAEQLAQEGIEVEVLDPRTLVPLDVDLIVESVKKTGRVVIVHEAVQRMGFGAEIGMRIVENAFEWLDAPIARVASENLPVPYSPAIGTKVIPTVDDVIAAVKGFWD